MAAALLQDPGDSRDRLIPLRIEEIARADTPPIIRARIAADLFEMDEQETRQALLDAVAGPRRPTGKPTFPQQGQSGAQRQSGKWRPPLPGHMPRVWHVPVRDRMFTGRGELLVKIRECLTAGDRGGTQVLCGMGGVGKTQLASEFAYRFGRMYDLVWWIKAEQPTLIAGQFDKLAAELGCANAGGRAKQVRAAVLEKLRQLDGWLLVFDNARRPADLERWLPTGDGHVLVTSQTRDWPKLPKIEVDVLARSESVTMLREWVKGLSEVDADRVAHRLGDLPLVMAQAGGYMSACGMTADRYVELLDSRTEEMLSRSLPKSHLRPLAVTIRLIAAQLASEDPAAAELANLCAFLGPEPIPHDFFTKAVADLSDVLSARAADLVALYDSLEKLAQQALARLDQGHLQMHRLTQDILRTGLTPEQQASTRARVEAILVVNDPGDPTDPQTWPAWEQLMPHLLAADLAGTELPGLRESAYHACRYLIARGDARPAHNLVNRLYRAWCKKLGEDHQHTLMMAHYLAWALADLGELEAARRMDEDTFARRHRVLGEDHPDTLHSASNLVATLSAQGQLKAAQELCKETLARRRRTLGEDHPDTLVSATNLAGILSAQDKMQDAWELGQDTLARLRRTLGEDHQQSLRMASNLATIQRERGDWRAAEELGQDTLARLRRVLGKDHPTTLACASELAATLRVLSDYAQAQKLDEDTLERRRRVLGENHPDTKATVQALDADRLGLNESSDAG